MIDVTLRAYLTTSCLVHKKRIFPDWYFFHFVGEGIIGASIIPLAEYSKGTTLY